MSILDAKLSAVPHGTSLCSRLTAWPRWSRRSGPSTGEAVYVGNQAANHDLVELRDPLELDRTPHRHLGFGIGAHRCLAGARARSKLLVAPAVLPDRFPRLAPAIDEIKWRPGFVLRSLLALPLRAGATR